MRFRTSVASYVYDANTGRLVVIAESPAVTFVGDRADEDSITFLQDGFAVVNDRRGQVFKLLSPVVVEETTRSGNGGYTAVTTRWYDGEWRSSRHFTDEESLEQHLTTVGFALRWDSNRGEHTVLTRFGEHPPRRGVIIAATSALVTSW